MKLPVSAAVVAVVVATVAAVRVEEDRPLVQVNEGLVRGLTTTLYNITYLEFLGIPYATPPLGPLRFKNPVPAEPWEGELDASTLPPPCDQLVLMGREDCLYLNVYTPPDALETDNPLPVMVYIHGGAYYIGGSFRSHGFQTFVSRGAVVVAMQYRLGLFGFLSTEDEAAPGNQGLKDQTLALRWVKENIAYFGGDTNRITIFGSSAGSTSVHYQMLAPSAAGLFTGAIMQSGTTLSPWAKGRDFLATAQAVGERFDCPALPTDDLVACLQTVGAHLLDMSYFTLYEWNLQPFYIGPRVDGDYLPEEPALLLKKNQYNHVPTIMGVNRNEMAMETIEMYSAPSLISSLLENFNTSGPASLHLYPDEEPTTTATTTYDYYLGGIHITKDDSDNLTRMFTDCLFHVPHDWTTQLMSSAGLLFTYELDHRGEHGFTNDFLDAGLDLPQARNYVSHGDNNQYLMYPKYANLTTAEDRIVGNIFTSMWVNFASSGNPTPDDSLGFTWEMTEDPTNMQHLKILPQPYMEADERAETRAFWESLPLRINNLLHR